MTHVMILSTIISHTQRYLEDTIQDLYFIRKDSSYFMEVFDHPQHLSECPTIVYSSIIRF